MTRLLFVGCLAGMILLGGCIRPPVEEPIPEPDPLAITLSVEVIDLTVEASVDIVGGEPPYRVSWSRDAEVVEPASLSASSTFSHTYDEPGDHTISVSVQDSAGDSVWDSADVTVTEPPIVEYTITATAGGDGGSISPSGAITVEAGGDKTFTVRVFSGYTLGDVQVDGESILIDLTDAGEGVFTYTFVGVSADHAIHASFGLATPEPPLPPIPEPPLPPI